MIARTDWSELSAGLISIDDMEIERISVKDMYWDQSDHIWTWNNTGVFSQSIGNNISTSVVNLGMPNMSGKSSVLSLILDYRYKNMPDFNYRIYSNDELAIYMTRGY